MTEQIDVDVGPAGSAKISLRWGDGVYDFRLGIGQWRVIDGKCNVGPQELYNRFVRGTWRIEELRQVMLQGLIGGGKTPIEASKLVEHYVDGRPFAESVQHAIAIIGVAVVGPADDPAGKAKAATEAQSGSQTDGSRSLPSTAPGLQ